MNTLFNLLGIEPDRSEMICIVGAGGKTSALFQLARELADTGKSVLVTTTTAIYYPEQSQYDRIIVAEGESPELFGNIASNITVLGKVHAVEGKLSGMSPQFLDSAFSKGIFDFVLIEGDGAKGRPIKAPAIHEPVIPSHTSRVIGVVGLDSLGKAVCADNVHRPEEFCKVTGCSMGDIIEYYTVTRLVAHNTGLFKAAPEKAKRCLLLNKADGEEKRLEACNIVQAVESLGCKPDKIVVSSLERQWFKDGLSQCKGKWKND